MSLRKDENQWLIYDEESVTAAVKGVQSFLMALGAEALKRHPDLVLRAFANFGERVTNTHVEFWNGGKSEEPSEEQREVGRHLLEIYAWLSGEGERPDEALDQLHAAVVWTDKRAKAAGVSGPGWYRELVRDP